MDITLIFKGRKHRLDVRDNSNLLDAIRSAAIPIAAPCGGKGICRKCRVSIKGEGTVNACEYYLTHPVQVMIGDPPSMQILAESYIPDWAEKSDKSDRGNKTEIAVAVDIGTTTVVVFLEDVGAGRNLGVRSFVNPQQAYGADVISRILYTRENPSGLETLRALLLEEIESAISDLCEQHQVAAMQLGRMAITGNTTMLHIFRGFDPVSISVYPFDPLFLGEVELSPSEAGFTRIQPEKIILMPGISAYVGADIIAGMAAVDSPDPETFDLFLDIGTNGEMALIGSENIFCCATAAGPAFEGARISCGMGGVSGAVSLLTTDRFETIDNEAPAGICGSGLVDAIALLLDEQKIEPSGFVQEDITLMPANLHGRHPALVLTPQDIREVQLAKGAISAGIEVLRRQAQKRIGSNTTLKINRVWLAGGFGYALHPETAARIGLIPQDLADLTIRVGNTAGLGARLLLHKAIYRKRMQEVIQKSEYIELSTMDDFNELFVLGMGF